jgi:hypothetical protein
MPSVRNRITFWQLELELEVRSTWKALSKALRKLVPPPPECTFALTHCLSQALLEPDMAGRRGDAAVAKLPKVTTVA